MMKIYHSLIIGSGYTSLGYAVAIPNSIIIEESQICDTQFYLPLCGYAHGGIKPKTREGSELYEHYSALGLFGEMMQNLNGFESAFCGYALEKSVEILLKSRVIAVSKQDDALLDVSIISPSGIIHVLTERIVDMRSSRDNERLTVLFTVSDAAQDLSAVAAAFPDAEIEQAFFAHRYALHIRVDGDCVRTKADVYERWKKLNCGAKLIYTAPVLSTSRTACDGIPTDSCFVDPIAAFEAGICYARMVAEI